VPALIEARKHDAAIVQRFAETELDKLGRAIPGEAVASDDPDILADVLRAFGRTRDVDAVRVALSFANSDRRKVRQAAREAIAGIGEAGRWQLRDAYQDLTGDKPDKSVAWDVLARQIFAIYDKGRLAEFERLVEDGLQAAKAGKHADAVASFDKVLARDPLFDRRKEMAPSYLAVASSLPLEQADEKLALLRKAQRLDPGGADDKKIEGQIAYVEARLLMRQGRPDRFLLERAIELDPSNKDARDALATFEEKAVEQKKTNLNRFVAAGAVFVGMVALALGIGLWGRKRTPPNEPPPPGDAPPPEPPAPPAPEPQP
jgi:tetratricopeptide (TPR) repeat protein